MREGEKEKKREGEKETFQLALFSFQFSLLSF